MALMAACLAALVGLSSRAAHASTAYGDLNNFDVFNDTGTECHGFEIELDDVRSTDITYTFDWNHYGAPRITEDNSDPAHPKVFVRYAGTFSAATSSFSAYTAIPAAPPSPTDGHQCTNPSVNIGCEHFGVGYYGTPTLVRYNWLIDDPAAPGNLIRGPAVNVATPSWTYYPPAPAQPVAQVQAVILAPPPPPAPVYEFGDATWVKCIVTTSHNNQVVELKDLVSDDPDDPNDHNWANGEPDEVEIEWRLLQTEFNNPGGANNELAGGNEDLPHGDEVITRRYEFYKYVGPLDAETNEAKCDNYPQIADPASPKFKPECDPAAGTILGDYIGAQMAGFNVEAALGLIDHIQDGDLDQPYTSRTVVVGGNTPYDASIALGALPAGLVLDPVTGVLSGTPTAAGLFSFTVTATDADAVQATRDYTVRINDQADGCPDDPLKTDPGACGCGVPDTDSDGDGSADCVDECVADPAKTTPGVCGCGVADTDSDGDGTLDCHDQCAADAAKTAPGVCGCGVADTDSDGDGTLDCHDQCAADAAKTAPGVCGCGVADTDSDGDGTPDCHDQCAADAGKTSPGTCGCGVADTDSDADGTPNCNDQCAADSAKTAPGVCGCSVADTDSDGDGTPNCNDQCPTDALKVVAGACGCGVADSDANNNGIADCLEGSGADLRAKLSPQESRGKVGKHFGFSLKVKNRGPASATSVTARFECSGVAYRVDELSDDCVATGTSITCTARTLRPDRSANSRIVIVPKARGTLSCTATASSATPDPNPANDATSVNVQVR